MSNLKLIIFSLLIHFLMPAKNSIYGNRNSFLSTEIAFFLSSYFFILILMAIFALDPSSSPGATIYGLFSRSLWGEKYLEETSEVHVWSRREKHGPSIGLRMLGISSETRTLPFPAPHLISLKCT